VGAERLAQHNKGLPQALPRLRIRTIPPQQRGQPDAIASVRRQSEESDQTLQLPAADDDFAPIRLDQPKPTKYL
jgi:hypothetical protein